jgi:hypothetical protein
MPLPKGFHWSVEARENRVSSARQTMPYRGAVFSTIESSADDERVAVRTGPLGRKIINFAYPFASANAWIRGQPEVSTTMLTIIGADSNDLQPVGYFDATKASSAVTYRGVVADLKNTPQADVPDVLPYRNLTPGDVDIASNYSQAFLGLKDVFQARGGLSHLNMTSNGAELETSLLRVHGPQHRTLAALNDETRFGAVRRAKAPGTATNPALIRGNAASLTATGSVAFAKEHSVVLNWKTLTNGGRLIDHRQGIVVEDNGDLAKSSVTQQELRARFRWFSTGVPVSIEETKAEIDNSGNWYIRTSKEALVGGRIEIESGSLAVVAGQKMSLDATSDVQLTSSTGRLTASANTGFTITTKARGEVNADQSLLLRTTGVLGVKTDLANGVQIGSYTVGMPMHPILLGNPAYLQSYSGWLGAESAFNGLLGAYGTAAAAAWTAIGPLTMLIDPTGSVASLCLAAAASASAMAASAPVVTGRIASHMPTLGSNPTGFLSTKTLSE